MELLLIRIDHFADRKQYLSILRTWLSELRITQGRIITMGALQLLFIVSTAEQNAKLLEFYTSKNIDINSRHELCVDRFIDVLGRKSVEKAECKGFLEMNILNRSLLEQMLVQEWKGEKQWLDTALETDRTKTFIEWRESAKAARKERRKRSAQEKQAEKELKKQQAAEEGDGSGSDTEKADNAAESTGVETSKEGNADEAPSAAAEAVPKNAGGNNNEKKPKQQQQQKPANKPQQKQQAKPANQSQQKLQQQPKQQTKPATVNQQKLANKTQHKQQTKPAEEHQQKRPAPPATNDEKQKADGSSGKRPRKRARHSKK